MCEKGPRILLRRLYSSAKQKLKKNHISRILNDFFKTKSVNNFIQSIFINAIRCNYPHDKRITILITIYYMKPMIRNNR